VPYFTGRARPSNTKMRHNRFTSNGLRRHTRRISGLVQNSQFSGNTTDCLCSPYPGVFSWLGRLVPREWLVTEQLQPVRLGGACQQLCRTFPHPLRVLAPQEPPVIEEELQQRQGVRTQVPPQEEVVPQA